MKTKLENSSRITHHASRPVKAVALYSGGLDSTLAVLTVLRQGLEVKAVTFLNHFGCDISDKSSCKDPFLAANSGLEANFAILLINHPDRKNPSSTRST
jgi:PP-loop superfamily ATP-utilizing enzyme